MPEGGREEGAVLRNGGIKKWWGAHGNGQVEAGA